MAKEITEEVKEVKTEPIKDVGKVKYSKESLLKTDKYFNRQDLLKTLLKDEVEYSLDEVDKLVENFMKGEVK